MTALGLIVVCGLIAIAYGIWAITSVMSADAGSDKMQEISAAHGVAPGMRFWHGPADLRPPFWAGQASFLCARRSRGDGVGRSKSEAT